MRLAFISNHPAPYRDAFLSRLVATTEISADVYSLFPGDIGHSFWDLSKASYKSRVIVASGESEFVAFLKLSRFVFSDYYVVCWPGCQHWYLSVLLFFSAMFNRRYGFCADTVEQRARSWLVLKIKKYIVRKAAFIFVPGRASERFFTQQFHVSPDRIIKGAYALDGGLIDDTIERLRRQGKREEIRGRYRVASEATVFLMVANMIPSRLYPITSSGFVEFAQRHENCVFIMVGSGPDLNDMRSYAAKHSCLRVVEGCSFAEMLELYAAADVYVHGGKEPASTALIIGALARLPLISSQDVGCSLDVLVDGETGILVPSYKRPDAWTMSFERAYSNIDNWRAWGCRARKMAEAIDVSSTIERFVEVMKNLVGSK